MLRKDKSGLTDIEYIVTQGDDTEPSFMSKHWDHFAKGIYVDKISGKPLPTSERKFHSECGWPSFFKALDDDEIIELVDKSFSTLKIEVHSEESNNHLGYVFNDGPKESGGLRCCISSAAIQLIPYEKLEELGYDDLMSHFGK